MKTLYLDCFAGISGDMLMGALLDLGLDLAILKGELGKLPLGGYDLEAFKVDKNGIQATQFQVHLLEAGGKRIADSEFTEIDPRKSGVTERAQAISELGNQHPGRSLIEILEIIAQSEFSNLVKTKVVSIFERLGQAEAEVHGVGLEEVHFHEVGGVDAIVDIVGAVAGLELLGIEEIYASALPLGSGFVRSSHGILPVPAPATAALLRGVPVYSGPGPGELVTPTGAAIISCLANGFGSMPYMFIEAVGYGSGTRQREYPNVLRVFLGTRATQARQADLDKSKGRDPFPEQHIPPSGIGGYHESPAIVIEANLDDMNPQFYDPLVERLLGANALDVVLIPVQMKKGRPGVLLQVLSYPTSLDDLLGIIFNESTTIGVRAYPVIKRMLQRESQTVTTPYGYVQVKVARLGERIVSATPEFEDCRRLAEEHQVPIKDVYAMALGAYYQRAVE